MPGPDERPTGPLRPTASGATLNGLRELLTGLGVPVRSDPGTAEEDRTATGVTLDSRAVQPGDLYAALRGANAHGAQFAEQAVAAGAVAVLTDEDGLALVRDAGLDLPVLVVPDPRAVLGRASRLVYREPSARIVMLAVTGTNGKTTTTTLLHGALTALGRPAGLIGTIETRIGQERIRAVRTTPESPDLHGLLAVMAERGVVDCAMEVSSHALALHRVDGVRFDVAGFTNLSQDHLDFHATMQEYFRAKASLFTPELAAHGVICVDDDWGAQLAELADIPVRTLATRPGRDADWTVTQAGPAAAGLGTDFTLTSRDGQRWDLTCPLPGDYNVANTAVAALMLHQALDGQGYTRQQLGDALARAGQVPGRMELVTPTGGPPGAPLAVVDYAHSPDSIASALAALRAGGAGPLVIVFGAGGDRDRGKREPMGEAAAAGADVVVVTDDNPRSEPPQTIRAAVLAGAHRAQQAAADQGRTVEVVEIGDRRRAIEHAVNLVLARGGGSRGRLSVGRPTVLLAGKGHETGQEIAGTVHPFDDRVVLAQTLDAALGAGRQEGS